MSAEKDYPRDEEYYLTNVVLLVEGYLFSVPRYYFANKSEVFSDMFSLPPQQDTKLEGSCDASPLHLEGVSRIDFKGFLRALYPMQHIQGNPVLSKKEWVSALKLGSMWGFRDVRQLAIRVIEKADGFNAIDRVLLGKEFKVYRWLYSGYNDLATRAESISAADVGLLGLEKALQMFQLREEVVRKRAYREYELRDTRTKVEILQCANDALKEELEEVKAAEAAFDALPSVYNWADA
ncbi:hypothetical protein DXG01_011391 [Tephrocybe rancida]|nr:hypothetical protein DXG01_011391 [Tephrocybe rancida]